MLNTQTTITTVPARVPAVGGPPYEVKIAETDDEIESALRLRYEVFRVEMGDGVDDDPTQIDRDRFDASCRHLIVIDRASARTIGTYRLNTIETADAIDGFYSHTEFSIEDLPHDVIARGVEIGRACIAAEHRNTRVLFLLWRGLADYLRASGKRYFFGCCSIFTRDSVIGERAFRHLAAAGYFHPNFRVEPRRNALYIGDPVGDEKPVELPNLFNIYLRLGARVCGPPIFDADFGSIDFFVVCDTEAIGEKYRRMFFG